MFVRFWGVILFSSLFVPDGFAIRSISFKGKNIEDVHDDVLQRVDLEVCPDQDSVSLDNMDLRTIRKKSIVSNYIKSVSLRNNSLDDVPAEMFTDAPNIECIDFTNNNMFLETLPYTHNGLKKLILNNPKKMYNHNINVLEERFPNLESLHLNGHYYGFDLSNSFNFKDTFPRLHTLHLAENYMFSFQEIIRNIPVNVQSLHLEHNNIKSINVIDLGNLNALYLDENPIRYFRIEDKNLRILSLSRCGYNQVQGYLNVSSLEKLDLSSNNFKYIERTMLENVPNLRSLSLSKNLLSEVPDLEYLWNLERLSISHNLIKSVTQIKTESLKVLSLQKNEINEVEVEAFWKVPQLIHLDLSENKLQHLPSGWSNQMTQLQFLNLRGNLFSTVINMELTPLLNLKHLYVEMNSMTSVDEDTLQGLSENCTIHVA